MSEEEETPVPLTSPNAPPQIAPNKPRKRLRCGHSHSRKGDDNENDNGIGAVPGFPFLESEAYTNRYRSWVLLSLALLVVCLSSGLIYGWPALRSRLLWEYNNNSGNNSKTTASANSKAIPTFTEEQLGLMYTFGSWSTQGGRFFIGLARDRFGTKIVACASLLALLAGLVGIGLAASADNRNGIDDDDDNDAPSVVVLTISLFLVGLGSGVQLCVQPVAGLFPDHTGIVLSSLSGAFQVSGLVFLVLTSQQETSLRTSFFAFGACIVMLIVISAILLPRGDSFLLLPPPKIGFIDDEHSQNENEIELQTEISLRNGSDDEEIGGIGKQKGGQLRNETQYDESMENENDRAVELGESDQEVEQKQVGEFVSKSSEDDLQSPSPPPTAWQQIQTPEYFFLVTWFSIGIVPMQYYVGIIGYQLEALGDHSGLYTDLFSYCFAGAAITAPLAGYIADKYGLGVAQGLSTGMVAVPFLLLVLKDSLGLRFQAVGLMAYGIGRMGIFGLYFTNCGKRFGYRNYGSLAGLGLLISALVSLLQYPLITVTVQENAPQNSTIVNALLVVVLLVQAPYFVWLYRRERSFESAVAS